MKFQLLINVEIFKISGKFRFSTQHNAAGENSSGFTKEQSLQGGSFSGDLLDQKSKPLLFPGPGWGVVTNEYYC